MIYGKSGEETSALYDPLYTMRTTIGGQMFLSLWTEKLVEAIPEIKFIQHNTDGITYMVPRKDLETVNKISKEMTELTGLYIEDNFYSKFVLRDVKLLRRNLVNCWKPKSKDMAISNQANYSIRRLRDYRKAKFIFRT